MPSETDQPNMWTNYDHDHVRPHVRGGLKKQLSPPKKVRSLWWRWWCVSTCQRPADPSLPSPAYLPDLYLQSHKQKYIWKEEEEIQVGKKWPETILGSSRTELRCSIKSRQSPRNSLRWGIHHFISPRQIYAWLWTWINSYLLLALDFYLLYVAESKI